MYETTVSYFKMYEFTAIIHDSLYTSVQIWFVSQHFQCFFVHLRSYGAAISAIASADAPWFWALQLLDDMCSNSVEDGSGMK